MPASCSNICSTQLYHLHTIWAEFVAEAFRWQTQLTYVDKFVVGQMCIYSATESKGKCMKKQCMIVWLILILTLVVGCNSTAAPASLETGAGEAAGTELDLSTLAETIDPQTVAAIKDRDDVFVIDVREPWEYEEAHIPGINLIPMNTIPNRLGEIPTDKTVVLTCRSGNRSGQVFQYLKQQGFTNIHNMQGGIVAWQGAGLPVEQ